MSELNYNSMPIGKDNGDGVLFFPGKNDTLPVFMTGDQLQQKFLYDYLVTNSDSPKPGASGTSSAKSSSPTTSVTPFYLGKNKMLLDINNPKGSSYGIVTEINNNKGAKKTITKYYYYKILDSWLYKDLLPLLAFTKIQDGRVRIIKSLNEFDMEKLMKDSEEDIEKKVEYFEKNIITKDLVKHVLNRIMKEKRLTLTELKKNHEIVKKYTYKYLSKKIRDNIKLYD